MKKLFVILIALALIISLPLFVSAEETTEGATEELTESSAVETETEYEMNLGFYPDTLQTTLPIMGIGMLGIFLVTCVIVVAVAVLIRLGRGRKE